MKIVITLSDIVGLIGLAILLLCLGYYGLRILIELLKEAMNKAFGKNKR